MKSVAKRRASHEPGLPENALRRAAVLQSQRDRLNPFPRPRGFVSKAKTWEDYKQWHLARLGPDD